MKRLAPPMLSADEAAALHRLPQVTETKLARLRLLAGHHNPKIRESVASSLHAPEDLYAALASDPDEGVRACVAKNEATPCDVLRRLADDASERVRGWVAVNYFVPDDVMERLAEDDSDTVRSLVRWKTSLKQSS